MSVVAAVRAVEGGFLDDLIKRFYAAVNPREETEALEACRARVAEAFDDVDLSGPADVARGRKRAFDEARRERDLERSGMAIQRAFRGAWR